MSTGGTGFADAAKDDEFEALLQKTYQSYDADKLFGMTEEFFSAQEENPQSPPEAKPKEMIKPAPVSDPSSSDKPPCQDTLSNAQMNSKVSVLHSKMVKTVAELESKIKMLNEEKEREDKESTNTIESLCKKLKALKDVERQNSLLEKQLHSVSVEKVQVATLLESAQKVHQQDEQKLQLIIQQMQSRVDSYEQERQTQRAQAAQADRNRAEHLAKIHDDHEHVTQNLRRKITRLEDDLAELKKNEKGYRMLNDRQKEEYEQLAGILGSREQAYNALEFAVDNLEYQQDESLQRIRELETELAALKPERLLNPPLLYSQQQRSGSQHYSRERAEHSQSRQHDRRKMS